MSIENKKSRSKSVKDPNEILKMLNNNNEYLLNSRTKLKAENVKKINNARGYEQINENEDENYILHHKFHRSNSVDLYKKHKMKKSNKTNKNDEIYECFRKNKKVSFLKPQFITIIEVESYKKYNELNTIKDPYAEIFKSVGINYNNNKNNEQKENGKESINCSCHII